MKKKLLRTPMCIEAHVEEEKAFQINILPLGNDRFYKGQMYRLKEKHLASFPKQSTQQV